MRSKHLIIASAVFLLIFCLTSLSSAQDNNKKPEIGITLLGGYYWPWMDLTVEGTYKEEGSPKKIFYEENYKGSAEKKGVGGAGVFMRKDTHAFRLTLQYGKSTAVIYDDYKYNDNEGRDTTLTLPDNVLNNNAYSFSKYYFSQYQLSFAAMQYIPLRGKQLNFYVGGGIGMSWLSYYDYIDDVVQETSNWGFHMYPILGLEFRLNNRFGIYTEFQYLISSTFKKDFLVEGNHYLYEENIYTFESDYHLNTDGASLQAGLYFLAM
ncbi:MAG: hypothetical protein ACOYVF_03190 [Candidatus Zixiibacteriota bacterium]